MTGKVKQELIEVRQGDSFTINIAVSKSCGQPTDLTGASLLMQVRTTSGELVFSVSGTPVDVLNGKMALLLTPTETSEDVGDYLTDIQLTMADGSVNTIYPANVNKVATFRITEQITQGE